VRKIFTTVEAAKDGITESALRHGVRKGLYVRVGQGVYIEGPEPPTELESALALGIATGGVVSGTAAGTLHELDSMYLKPHFATVPAKGRPKRPGVRRQNLFEHMITEVYGYRCTNGLQTMIDLAAHMSDRTWEQALESALRKRLTTIADLDLSLYRLGRSRTPGTRRIRRVLAQRPEGAPPTESLLETRMVQLIREHTTLPTPTRQVEICNAYDRVVARVDLAWPERGLFIELDGQHHLNQPVHDARRETEIVATTGWLPGRFTWTEVTRVPIPTARRVEELYRQATRATRRV
jgi:very-short-patch-repair endonuclease